MSKTARIRDLPEYKRRERMGRKVEEGNKGI
jgi:hypothetical protein